MQKLRTAVANVLIELTLRFNPSGKWIESTIGPLPQARARPDHVAEARPLCLFASILMDRGSSVGALDNLCSVRNQQAKTAILNRVLSTLSTVHSLTILCDLRLIPFAESWI